MPSGRPLNGAGGGGTLGRVGSNGGGVITETSVLAGGDNSDVESRKSRLSTSPSASSRDVDDQVKKIKKSDNRDFSHFVDTPRNWKRIHPQRG